MKVMIDDLQIQGISYCGYNSIAILLKKLGIDFTTDLLGLEWGFQFHRRYDIGICEEYEKWVPDYYITTEINTVKYLLENFWLIRIKHVHASNINEYMKLLKTYIDVGTAVIKAVDVKYLKYFSEYQNRHSESYHYITICGYSTNEICFIDSSRSFVEGELHTVTYSEFYKMVQPDDNVFHLKLEFALLENTFSINNQNDSIRKKHFTESIEKMFQDSVPIYENGWVKYSGLSALTEFSKEMLLISKFGDEKIIQNYMKKIFPMIVMCSQQRKGNMSYLMKWLDGIHKDNDRMMELCMKLKQAWESLKLTYYNIRKKEWRIVAESSSEILHEIYKIEFELLKYTIR